MPDPGSASDDGDGKRRAPLTPEDRAHLSRDLIRVFDEARPLVQKGFTSVLPQSRAGALTRHDFGATSQGDNPGRNALDTMLFATLAGLDHARSFARALAEADVSFSLAALTRGSLEAYARAWWLADVESDKDFIMRWLSALASELETVKRVRPDQPLQELRGRDSSVQEQLEAVLDDIEHLRGSREALRLSYTTLAAALADKVCLGDVSESACVKIGKRACKHRVARVGAQ